MSLGLSSTFDIITFDQNWHHLWSTSAQGKDLFNDAQVRVIGLMEPEIQCMHKNAQKVEWKSQSKIVLPLHMATPWSNLPVSVTLSWKFFQLQASPAEGQSLQQKEKKRRKRSSRKKTQKSKAYWCWSKIWFLLMQEPKCRKIWCWRQELETAVLQMSFRPD